jgi:hypothetical protein
MEADVVITDPGQASIPKKHVANIRWTPARATVGIGMGKELYTVIQRAFAAQQTPFDGALHLADFNYKIQSSLSFSGAMLTSVTFPKMDGTSKDAAYFDLEWEAEMVRWLKGDGSDLRRPIAMQRPWLRSNFRFESAVQSGGGDPLVHVAVCRGAGPGWRAGQAPGRGDRPEHHRRRLAGRLRRVVSGGEEVVRRWRPRDKRRDVGRNRLARP